MFFRRLFGTAPQAPAGATPIVIALITGDFKPVTRGRADGRLLVHGLESSRTAPGPVVAEIGGLTFREDRRLVTVRGVSWRDVEFAGGKPPRCSLQGCSLQNLLFRDCDLAQWRFFSCRARDCTFRDTSLQSTAFSVMVEGEATVFTRCHFIRCDLREIGCKDAYFEHCVFEDCRIQGVDFSTAAFTDVRFTGELRDTIFRGRRKNYSQVNPMRRVDFSAAKLSWVEFYEIDLSHVAFPRGDDQITIENWGGFLDAIEEEIIDREDIESRQMRAVLGVWRKVRGPRQNRGFINLADIFDGIGPIGVEIVRSAISASRK